MADVADRSAVPGEPGSGGGVAARASEPSDEAALARLGDGDPEALGELYDRHGRLCYSQARHVCGAPDAAEDVVREVFVGLWRDPGRFDPGRGGFPSWLLAEVHRRAVETVRRAGRPGPEQAGVGSTADGPVNRAFQELSGDQRRTIALAFYGGYTQREVAAITGVPASTVGARIYSATQRLRRLLGGSRSRAPARSTGSDR